MVRMRLARSGTHLSPFALAAVPAFALHLADRYWMVKAVCIPDA